MTEVEQILKQAQKLSSQERSLIIARLQAQNSSSSTTRRRAWREIAGTAPYLMRGADAQDWISENRLLEDRERASESRR